MNRPVVFKKLFLFVAFVVVFVSGVVVGDIGNREIGVRGASLINGKHQEFGLSKELNTRLYGEVWDEIQKKYVGAPIADSTLFYGSLSGLVRSIGDRYSMFYTPQEASDFDKDLEGEFEGIGAEIGVKRDRIVVIAPLPESPAQRAGLQAGDWIAMIDEEPTQGMSLDEAVKKIRGPKGTTVTLEIVRGTAEGFQDNSQSVPIVRDRIVIHEVEVAFVKTPEGKSIAHVHLYSFNKNAFSELREVALQIQKKDIHGLIFDLRNNGGGLLDQAADVAGLWLPSDAVVTWEAYSGGDKDSLTAGGSQLFARYPTIVLINKGSASASEIVAGALQDHRVATLVGETSFGKGSVQTYEKLSDGSALKLTVAKWLTPKERAIDGQGITPDVEIELSEDDFANDRDPQLQKALEVLDEQSN